tara:strand:- start:7034 stop:7459 length:426 start_codon:yes stop_codon:yes gene_type:complete
LAINGTTNSIYSLGKNIEQLSIYYGFFLFIWGVTVSLLSGSTSFTSYIPSYIGSVVILFSYLSIKFSNKKKLFMHIVALTGVLIVLGGLDVIRTAINGKLFNNYWADMSKIMMLVTGVLFVYFCFASFRFARKMANKEINN